MNIAIRGTNPTNGAAMIQILTPRPGEGPPYRRACAWITAMSSINPVLEFRCYAVRTDETRLVPHEIATHYGAP